MRKISLDEAKSVLAYDAVTGVFTWLPRSGCDRDTKRWNTRFAGKEAGSFVQPGYRRISIFDVSYLAHRLAWLFAHGEMPEGMIDHENMNGLDNRLSNLRLATHSQNNSNRPVQKNNLSGAKGVRRDGNRWRSQIMLDGISHHLGCFPTQQEAAAAYAEAATRLHGEYARV